MSYALLRYLRRATMSSNLLRMETTVTSVTPENWVFRPSKAHWGKVIREAEKIVGYPTSFMNLRWLLSDEFANLALYLRKVVGSNHPIIETAKSMLYNEQNNKQPWGLIILLLSNAIGENRTPHNDNPVTENQRILAELTEMIRTGHHIHRGIQNTTLEERQVGNNAIVFGNKIALLIGDYLLVTANGMLARIKNQELSYLISTALRDISEGEFYGPRDRQNIPIPGKIGGAEVKDKYLINCDLLPLEIANTLGHPEREWTTRGLFNGASLFGRGCQGALMLDGKNLEDQNQAYLFGCHLCLAWQLASEMEVFNATNKDFSLVSAPVLFALQSNPELYSIIDVAKEDVKEINYSSFKDEIMKTDAVEKSRQMHRKHLEKTCNLIEYFGDNHCVDTMKKLIRTYY